jgi:light-regulated signal transduction histidine kinase (bacteriophytochrome)
VSDVMMPRLDGFGLVRELRADPSMASLPVILLSARAGDEAAVEGLDTGADDYLVKPFSARELLARVRTHVLLAQTRRAWIAELETKNEELEAFAYSASHDLRAPLRAIDSFSRALLDDLAGQLDDAARSNLDRVRRAASRMSTLIDDLLRLARVTRGELRRGTVNLSALAHDIAAQLQERDPARVVDLQIAEKLEVDADHGLLRTALENLIGNAWKYSSKRERAVIEVGVAERDGKRTYFVRDNGVGFDPAHGDKLFKPFQRLHSEKDFEGTGIGLATVQRIITRHRGRVWAEGERERGATVYFQV